ncbi:beta-glucosidase BglX [Bacteroides sp. 51]|uniref:beta-glucosidase BglX n=1 Tax=Bacteroides sp. 51 TaxID=2302938 RepID=UPI0013D69367|nr:beta-glucosidase BglX [Bacteroides sp. 51]NDV82078.1 beta-glucosidase BglX [Bacteroides sp. 51]
MKKKYINIVFLALALIACSCGGSAKWSSYSKNKTIEERVDSLLALMTLEEKIGQMTQYSGRGDITGPAINDDIEPYLKKGLIGSIFNTTTVQGIRRTQELALSESRLKIPVLFGYDVIHGFKTIFPMPLAESCSWDLELMKKSAAIAAEEAAAAGVNWTFAPMVDIARDARWGRVMEGAGEDTYLGALIAETRVKGFQGDTPDDLYRMDKVLACAKHFCAYGAAESGRDYNIVDVSERTLRDVYLPPFEAAKDAGVATFMTAFNEISGMPCTASKFLYTDVLRNEWNFNGFVVTDYTAINELIPHGVAADEPQAARLAANAGIDMDMTGGVFLKNLKAEVEAGRVSEEVIDRAVRRILEMKFIIGLMDDPFRYLDAEREKATILKPEFLEVARDAGRKSIVLLKNDNKFLPISPAERKTIALIGPMVKNKRSMNGEWAGRGDRNQSASLFEGLTERYKDTSVRFLYAEGCDLMKPGTAGFAQAVSIARQADIVLVAAGEDYNWSGEAACRTDITLPGSQRDLLKELKKTGKPIGLVLMNGRPLDLSWEDQNLDAIMEAWYLGTMAGHAMADVIAGDYNPSAKLTMSFPRNVGQIPIYYNRKNTGRPMPEDKPETDYRSSYIDVPNSPLYPFGYGLSYTTFSIGNMKLSSPTITKGETLTITADVTNAGDRDGEEIVQLYIRDLVGSVTRPVKELKGFSKVALAKGETKQVTFTLTDKDLAFCDINMQMQAEPGDFKVWVASSSAHEEHEGTFTLK